MRLRGEALFGKPAAKLDGALGEGDALLATLEAALLAGKIVAYAQGFAVMAKASDEWKWNLPLGTIARIWRAGCIIRSVFLDDISKAYAAGDPIDHLMLAAPFADMMRSSEASLRRVVAEAVSRGLAVPALSSALAYYDMARSGRTTANLLQGQRDYFGAHGFQRTDKEGDGFHGPWTHE
jgi:6-phosphogluconate dehydrogenase